MSSKQAEIEAATRQVIESVTAQGFMFTALDISNEVKQQLTGVRHREIAPVVRQMYEKGVMGSDYTRKSIDVTIAGGKKVQALLYFDKSDDPDDYDGSLRQQKAIPPTKASPSYGGGAASAPSPAQAAPSAPLSNQITLSIDHMGRAEVPRSFLARAGLTDDSVYLDTATSGSGLVLSEPDSGSDPLTELEFEGDAIYIPRRYLSAFDSSAPIVARLGIRTVDIEGRIR